MPHVLRYVVDDDAAIRVALERAPRLEGFAVSTGNGGEAALADIIRTRTWPAADRVLDFAIARNFS